MKVFILDNIKTGKYGISSYFEIIGKLDSGAKIYIDSYHYNLEKYVYHEVEMLLCVWRSPYLERGRKNQLFSPSEFYSIELIDELYKEQNITPNTNKEGHTLTGEFIDTYTIPEEWVPLIAPGIHRNLLKRSSALNTEDGLFLLSPLHLEKHVPIEEFPQQVSIATELITLVAWHPI
jgi:hypothetical protein